MTDLEPDAPAWLTPREAGEVLRVSARHVRRLIEADLLAATDLRVPGAARPVWRIRRESVDELLVLRSNAEGQDGHWLNRGPVRWDLTIEEFSE